MIGPEVFRGGKEEIFFSLFCWFKKFPRTGDIRQKKKTGGVKDKSGGYKKQNVVCCH